ncbi:MAG: hypothetical protein K8R36_15165 [Planctomycetales bacterium]|nr:hypothetical protein [Planctomycetales bacterium]
MRRTFAALLVLVVLVVAVGFYRGWFSVTSHSEESGKDVDVHLRVDKGQIAQDAKEVKEEAVDLLGKVKAQTTGSGTATTPVR